MRFRRLLFVLAVAAVFCVPRSADAQRYQGYGDNPVGPTVSPYLNLLDQSDLLRPTNYQSLVRPLVNQGDAIRRQGASIGRLQQQQRATGAPSATGHQTYFMYYSHYYPQGGR